MLIIDKLILDFLTKYLFILKAASYGWRVKYIGGDNYKFYKSHRHSLCKSKKSFLSCNDFLSQFRYDFF